MKKTMKKQAFLSSLGSVSLLLTVVCGAYTGTAETIDTAASDSLNIKVVVTAIGLGLIVLELWWFLAKNEKSY